jgi:hypothetical protein
VLVIEQEGHWKYIGTQQISDIEGIYNILEMTTDGLVITS